jgi:hypothetical protein
MVTKRTSVVGFIAAFLLTSASSLMPPPQAYRDRVEVVQDGRIYIERVNGPFLAALGAAINSAFG